MEKDRFLSSKIETFQPTYMDFRGAALSFGRASHFCKAEFLWQTLTCLHLRELTHGKDEGKWRVLISRCSLAFGGLINI